MPWFRFDQRFDHHPVRSVMRTFPAGWEGLVTTACADAAEAAGKGKRDKNHRRKRVMLHDGR